MFILKEISIFVNNVGCIISVVIISYLLSPAGVIKGQFWLKIRSDVKVIGFVPTERAYHKECSCESFQEVGQNKKVNVMGSKMLVPTEKFCHNGYSC